MYGTMRQQVLEEHQPRGVYLHPRVLSKDGHPLWYCVGSHGRELGRAQQLPGMSAEDVKRYLQFVLDRDDPIEEPPPRPDLRLVKPAPSAPRTITVEELDRIYVDADPIAAMNYQRRRARLAGSLRSLPQVR